MNALNLPGFTAGATLYKTSGHYQTNRNWINRTTQMVGAIYPAEVIKVGSCRPGHVQLGEGEDMVCIDPSNPFGTHGHDGDELSGGHGPDSVPTGGGGVPPKKPKKPKRPEKPEMDRDRPQKILYGCSENQINSDEAKPCVDQMQQDLANGEANLHHVTCTGSKVGNVAHPKMECCQKAGDHITVCHGLN